MDHSHHQHLGFDLSAVDPLALAGFVAVFSYSFLVSLHCIGMCGPLACSLLGTSRARLGRATFLYNAGRLVSYILAGAGLGYLSVQISAISLRLGSYLSLALGLILILWALALPVKRLLGLDRQGPWPWQLSLHRFLNRLPADGRALGLGLCTVFLPCMTLHPLLLAAAGSQSTFGGAATMLAFGLGTLPAMVTATYMPTLILDRLPVTQLQWAGRFFLGGAGIITVWRAWPLL